MQIVFGIVWAIDGSLKFAPGFVNAFSGMISNSASGSYHG
jgi:hypothetical protein